MLIVRGIRLSVGESAEALQELAAKRLRVRREDIKSVRIVRRSLDARKKNDIHYLYSVAVSLRQDEKRTLSRARGDCAEYVPFEYEIPSLRSTDRPVIAGFGPAGMFASLVLARAGLRPIVLERGEAADRRRESVERFWKTGELDPESNVQFGEGGAGMFSDGKLNTGTHDARISWVLEVLASHGAPECVTYDAKPHVGTDVLHGIVKSIRREIESLGGEVHTNTRLSAVDTKNGAVCAVRAVRDGEELAIPCSRLILAVGHSARDTFEMLHEMGVPMEPKPFSMGVRIEHRQDAVGLSQYGEAYRRLPAADYKLNCRLRDGGSAYTFCMCPGGYVVAAASEERGVVTNGMSYSGRGGENANSALLVTLTPEDFPGAGPLAGMRWQRELERRAFDAGGGGYRAPAQRVGDFLARRAGAGPGAVRPTYRPGVAWCDLHDVLPEKICAVLEGALPELARRAPFFADEDAVMTAPETRSSSPVRILRSAGLESEIRGLYPCGEGAGYAGGITSAAVDGMKCAEAVMAASCKTGENNI